MPFQPSRSRVGAWLVLLLLLFATGEARGLPDHPIVAYHDSWNEMPAATAGETTLARLPGYISIVDLAFARPDLDYGGDLDLARTGLEYRFHGTVLRDAIALLKQRHPDTRVLLSVGGAVYHGWARVDAAAIARLVHDLGADGADIDYEPSVTGCTRAEDDKIYCTTDSSWAALVAKFRAVLPRPALLTASVWSVGAFGEGAYRKSRPVSPHTGLMLRFLQSPAAVGLDMLCLNAYDAGPQFHPMEAFRAYRAVWPGVLALGLAVQRDGGAGPYVSTDRAEALARRVAQDPHGAMMVYPLLALPDGFGSRNRPDGRTLASAICRGMGRAGCDATMP